jgi:ankyrin repeat protein
MKIIFLSIFTLTSVNVKAEKSEHQIFELIYSKNIPAAKKLILNKPEILSIKGKFGQTPLIAATNLNRKELIELIIKNSKTINEQDLGGATALHIAARNGNTEIVKILIDNGANLNIHDSQDYTPLTRALEFQRHDIVELIRQKSKTKAS